MIAELNDRGSAALLQSVSTAESISNEPAGNTVEAKASSAGSPYRKWCLTINNYTDEDLANINRASEQFKYCIFGKEKGKNGTPHLQMYINFKKPVRMSSIKKIFSRAHIERARGTDHDNQRYCSKDGDFIEIGYPQVQGKLTRGEATSH